jgi:outer membrane receptor protein involved in Fe transport
MNTTPRQRPSVRHEWAVLAALLGIPLAAQQAPNPPQTTSTEPAAENTIVLSPFTVQSGRDRGYFAENTLAGSRLNTNISDLGASISVVNKQLMEDTASVDINDVFRYEVNTEGSLTYTPAVLSLRSDGIADTISGFTSGGTGTPQTNATANRVRGIGVPSSAINYYPAIAQVPFDSYNLQSVEISRGPNSMLFGMGSPAGIVNNNTAQATLGRDTNTAQIRFDDRGSRRGSFSFNRSLIDDTLAIYGAFVWDDRRFERKPSYDKTNRQYGTITYRPLPKTTIRATAENYDNRNRRPNSITPRDFVTEWRNAGQPVYDPLTRKITKLSTGEVVGAYVANASSPYANEVRQFIESRPGYNPALWNAARTTYNNISIFGEGALTNRNSVLYVPGITWDNQARTIMQIGDGQVQNWFQPLGLQRYRTQWGTATNPAANADFFPTEAAIWANPTSAGVYNRYVTLSSGWSAPTDIGSYKYPGVTDKSIYDWSDTNINQMNFGHDTNTNYNIELEQEILPDLHLSAGWFRQDFKSTTNYTVAQLNVATLFVDTNRNLPNGQANPYFGQVYVEDSDPDQFINSEKHDHYRAMLAYTPDFTRNDGWSRWLGRHQILGLWSKQDSLTSAIRRRLHYVESTSNAGAYRYLNNQNNNADGSPTGWNFQSTSLRRRFYLANPGDPMGTVTRSSGEWNHLRHSGDIQVYNYATNQFETVNMTTDFVDRPEGTGRNERELESLSAGMTSYLWNERLVTTFGVRRDDYRARGTTNDIIRDATGAIVEPAMTNQQRWINGVYQTETVFNRWNRWYELSGDTSTIGGVLRPFRNWSRIDSRADSGSLWWQFVRDFGISYNKSDNFNAPSIAQVDVFGKALPKPTGEGEDIGIQFSLFDNKLFARVTWFEASNENERTDPGTSISRLTSNVDTTLFRNWARTIALINMGRDPRVANWDSNLTPAETAAMEEAASKIWGQPYTYYASLGSIAATRNAEAEGVEVQLTYNPSSNWTIRFTGGKQDTKYSGVMKEFDAWYEVRSPVWETARAADHLLPDYRHLATYTTSAGRQVDLTNFWSSYGYVNEIRLDEPNGNTNALIYYNNVVAPQYFVAKDLEGRSAPNQRKYRWSLVTNYNFTGERLRGWNVGAGQRWEDKSVIGYYGKSSGTNPTPGFLDRSDITRPIYDSDNWYTDVWVGYTRRILDDKVRMRLQLNVDNVFEDGGLQVVNVNYDGSPASYRIVDSRLFKLTATFDF